MRGVALFSEDAAAPTAGGGTNAATEAAPAAGASPDVPPPDAAAVMGSKKVFGQGLPEVPVENWAAAEETIMVALNIYEYDEDDPPPVLDNWPSAVPWMAWVTKRVSANDLDRTLNENSMGGRFSNKQSRIEKILMHALGF